jgi:hypothetical protein
MAVRDDDSNGYGALEGTPWDSGDGSRLEHLLKFVGIGSRLVFEFQPLARIGGNLGYFEIAPVVGMTRYADRHESICGAHIIKSGSKCLLGYDELDGLLKFLEYLTAPPVGGCDPNSLPVKRIHYETRTGFVMESVASRLGDVARVSVGSPAIVLLSRSDLEEFCSACHKLLSFLDEFHG